MTIAETIHPSADDDPLAIHYPSRLDDAMREWLDETPIVAYFVRERLEMLTRPDAS